MTEPRVGRAFQLNSFWRRRFATGQLQHAGVYAHTTASHGVEIDLERHLFIANAQAEQTADGALIVCFADAQHRMPDQRCEQATAFIGGELADVHRIAFADDGRVVSQQTPHSHRSTRGLGGAFDQVIGVFGGADDAQAQLRWFHRPACITEDAKHHLRDRFGPLLGRPGLRLGDGAARQKPEQNDQQCALAGHHTLCRPDGHLHGGILLERNEMMPQR